MSVRKVWTTSTHKMWSFPARRSLHVAVAVLWKVHKMTPLMRLPYELVDIVLKHTPVQGFYGEEDYNEWKEEEEDEGEDEDAEDSDELWDNEEEDMFAESEEQTDSDYD